MQETELKCEILIKKTNEDIEEKNRYEYQLVPMQRSILQLEEAAEKIQLSVDELKPFEVNISGPALFFKIILYR